MATTDTSGDLERELLREEARGWWIYLITGSIWLIFGWIVLSARSEITTVWAVAIYAGVLFFMFGMGELLAAFVVDSWRWLHGILGVIGIIAGIMAFAWPDQTFLTLAALIGWFLLFDGTLQLAVALMRRHEYDLWWLLLILGVVEILIAFWAIGYPGRSIVLLIIWVGATALAKGIALIVAGFALHSSAKRLAPPATA
jgi:uncharacterized membrane protein HdeD (DUF308 family)